jgi:hypothetical protein
MIEEESHKCCVCHLLNCDEGQGHLINNHMVNGARQKKRKTSQGLNVNILTRSVVQTTFLDLQMAVDHVQKQLSEISKKYFENIKKRKNQKKSEKTMEENREEFATHVSCFSTKSQG